MGVICLSEQTFFVFFRYEFGPALRHEFSVYIVHKRDPHELLLHLLQRMAKETEAFYDYRNAAPVLPVYACVFFECAPLNLWLYSVVCVCAFIFLF